MANLEPKAVIPFFSQEQEGMVSKLTLTLNKPVPIEDIITLIGTGKGKRLTDEPSENNTTPDAHLIATIRAGLARLETMLDVVSLDTKGD